MFKLGPGVELPRLKKAVESLFDLHPGLKGVVQLHEGVFKNFRHDGKRVEIPIQKMDDEEWEAHRKGLLRPFMYGEEDPLL